ncbi:hypothetical protein SRB17_59250 [Streptomyces sp. RB17]|uniref:hypothetical protein n=1 Tax=Streptomyces sp. RB17 TaxID=2585197 RepID=UPI001296D306|nr:hypothetical protein [Streptomyces sp. RB17]MQY37917.1 hypothetical protein [Streptomyces sp. RB17]
MRIRRILAAGIATAALAGLGLTGAATAASLTPSQGFGAALTPGECIDGGGTVDWTPTSANPHTGTCRGGTGNGQAVD